MIVRHFLLPLLLIGLGIESKAQLMSVSTAAASCEEVCDGVLSLVGADFEGPSDYYFKRLDELSFVKMESDRVDDLCHGDYLLKIKTPTQVDFSYGGNPCETKKGYERVQTIAANTQGIRDVTIIVALPAKGMDLSYFMSFYCSTDGGFSWQESTGLSQSTVELEADKMQYEVLLPKSCDNRSGILIDVHRRRPMRRSGTPAIEMSSIELTGMTVELRDFKVRVEEHMKINSSVSNEVAGDDGYISLDVVNGTEPLYFDWSDKKQGAKRTSLAAGDYEVTITDGHGCQETALYQVLPPAGQDAAASFDLVPSGEGKALMTISSLYRQPLTLQILDETGSVSKTFRINPLYQDLKMTLDLSFLKPGSYQCRLDGATFSQTIDLEL